MIKSKGIFKYCFFLMFMNMANSILAQPYIDGRPWTNKRILCKDYGIVLRYGDGPDSCDVLWSKGG